MTLLNTEYRITFCSKAGRFYYSFAKDGSGWHQIAAAGNRHKTTAEQVLNSGGATLVAEGTELIALVEVQCAAGHRFFGPEELIFRDRQVSTGAKSEPSAA